MYDENDQWDRYMTRYDGYCPSTLEGFVERGFASYDAEADTYTVWCDHGASGASGFSDCTGDADTCKAEPFTVGLRPEFASA